MVPSSQRFNILQALIKNSIFPSLVRTKNTISACSLNGILSIPKYSNQVLD